MSRETIAWLENKFLELARNWSTDYPFGNVSSSSSANHRRATSAFAGRASENPFEDDYSYQPRQTQPRASTRTRGSRSYDFDHDRDDVDNDRDVFGAPIPNAARSIRGSTPPPKLEQKTELSRPLKPSDGIARAIALFDFNAVQVSHDLSSAPTIELTFVLAVW